MMKSRIATVGLQTSEGSRSHIHARRTPIISKRFLSQILDGAAFPTIMLAIAVSQIKVSSHPRNNFHRGKLPAAELQAGDRVEQKAK